MQGKSIPIHKDRNQGCQVLLYELVALLKTKYILEGQLRFLSWQQPALSDDAHNKTKDFRKQK